MKLRFYLFTNKITVTKFAEEVNYARNYINLIANERVIPSKKLIKIIKEKTNGQVTENDYEIVSQKDDKNTIKKGEKKV